MNGYSSTEMQSIYPTAPVDWATRILVGGVLLLYRDAVDLFYSPSRLGYQNPRWGSLTPLQRCSRFILQPQSTGLPESSLGESYSSTEMQSIYPTAPVDWATRILVGGVLLLNRDAVDLFYSPNRLGYQNTRWGSLTPLQRCSRFILQPQSTGLPESSLGESYSSTEMQSIYPTAPIDWATLTLAGGVLLLYRDAVDLFYSPSRLGYQNPRWGSLIPLQSQSTEKTVVKRNRNFYIFSTIRRGVFCTVIVVVNVLGYPS